MSMLQVVAASDLDGNLIAWSPNYDELVDELDFGGWKIEFEPGFDLSLIEQPRRVANVYDERSAKSLLPTPEAAWEAIGNLRITFDDISQIDEVDAAFEFAARYPLSPQTGKLPKYLRKLQEPLEDDDPDADADALVRNHFLRQNYKTSKVPYRGQRVSVVGLGLVNARSWKNVAPGSLPRGTDFCVGASKYCARTCLIASGNQKSRHHYAIKLAFARLLLEAPAAFGRLLYAACDEHSKCPRGRTYLKPAVRLNVFSDLPWELIFPDLFDVDLQFYDYTKLVLRRTPPNYDLTFSTSGTNLATALAELDRGRRLAVVFNVRKGVPLPPTWNGFEVVDGDLSDARFLDPNDVVVGLRYKTVGALHYKTDRETAFVHLATYDESTDTVISETVPSQEPSWKYTDPEWVLDDDLEEDDV